MRAAGAGAGAGAAGAGAGAGARGPGPGPGAGAGSGLLRSAVAAGCRWDGAARGRGLPGAGCACSRGARPAARGHGPASPAAGTGVRTLGFCRGGLACPGGPRGAAGPRPRPGSGRAGPRERASPGLGRCCLWPLCSWEEVSLPRLFSLGSAAKQHERVT